MDLLSPVIYNDKDIKIRQSGLTIKNYFFPIAISKRIPITQIRNIQLIHQTSSRIWGTGSFQYWFALDSKRLSATSFLAIDNGHTPKPAFTCTDNDKAYQILKGLIQKNKLLAEKPKESNYELD